MPSTRLPQPFDLAIDYSSLGHRQPLIRRAGFRHERIDGRDDAPDRAAPPGVVRHPLADRQVRVPNRHEVLVGLAGKPDHEVELQVLDAGPEDQVGPVEDLVVGDRLVDHAAKPIGSGLRRDRDRPLAALAQEPDDRFREVVETQRRRADAVAHVDELREDQSRCPGDRRARSTRDPRAWRATAPPRQSRECGRSETRARAGSCSRPSRTGRGSRTRARPR